MCECYILIQAMAPLSCALNPLSWCHCSLSTEQNMKELTSQSKLGE